MTDNATALATKIDWSSLSGVILDGGYELKEVLDGRDDGAKLRVRILGSGGKTGTAYFLHLDSAAADDQFDIWQTLRDAPHPNINRPAALGRRDVAGYYTIYFVLADADEKLSSVVPERPLEWEEAAEVLHSCEKGLAHLHAHGLIHGSLSPETVEAVGYSVLLNTENVRRLGKKPRIQWSKPQYLAPESKGANLTTAADVWCLGATVFEVLSQSRYGSPGAELEKGLPLAAVIQRCLDKNPTTRCTLKEAPTIADSPQEPPPAPVAPEPVVETKPAPESRTSAPAAAPKAPPAPPQPLPPPPPRTTPSPASRLPHPLTPKEAPKLVAKEDMALVPVGKRQRKVEKRQPVGARIRTLDEPERVFAMGEASAESSSAPGVSARILALGNRPKIVRNVLAGIGLAVLFVAAIWLIIIPKLQSTQEPLTSNVSAQTANDARAEAAAQSVRTQPTPPTNETPAPTPAASQTPASTDSPATPPTPVKRELFRVTVATFETRGAANHELDLLSQLHPEFIFQIVMAKSDATDIRYTVTVGGILDRAEAEQLLQRVHAKGLKTASIESAKK